jgi:hypothetical protein
VAVLLTVSACMLANQLAASDLGKVNKLAVQCRSGNEKACRELAEIALKEKNPRVRSAAVANLAVENLTDQALLTRIAEDDEGDLVGEVRMAAMAKLTDQSVLAKIAVEDKDYNVRRAAAQKLTDQTLLAKIEEQDPHGLLGAAARERLSIIRIAAVAKLTDQFVVAKIAVEDKEDYMRLAATRKLTDQTLLAKIAVEDKDYSVRQTAVEKLTDQMLLAKIAVEDGVFIVRQVATQKLTDQMLLAKIAVEDKDYNVRQAAAEKLTDQTLLAKIAVEDKDSHVGEVAAEKLTDQTLLAKVAVGDGSFSRRGRAGRLTAIARLTDQAVLAKIAGDMGRTAANPEQAAARICLVLRDPTISKLVPSAEIRTSYESESKYYDRCETFPDGHELCAGAYEVEGEVISFTISAGPCQKPFTPSCSGLLAHDVWRTSFPREMAAVGSAPDAQVDATDMMKEVFRRPEFTQEDLLKSTQSQIPEVRAAAENRLTELRARRF